MEQGGSFHCPFSFWRGKEDKKKESRTVKTFFLPLCYRKNRYASLDSLAFSFFVFFALRKETKGGLLPL